MSHYFNPETEGWKPERRKQMLSNEDKNEIIEMLRCPACKGTTYSIMEEFENGFNYSVDCQNCNGTGIRLPEKLPVGDGVTDDPEAIQSLYNKPENVEEKSCKNCKEFYTFKLKYPCRVCTADMNYPMWQKIGEPTELESLKAENTTLLKRLSVEQQRNQSFENVRQNLYQEIKEKDKKIEKLKFDVAYWQARALQNGKPNTNYRVIETTTVTLKDGE